MRHLDCQHFFALMRFIRRQRWRARELFENGNRTKRTQYTKFGGVSRAFLSERLRADEIWLKGDEGPFFHFATMDTDSL